MNLDFDTVLKQVLRIGSKTLGVSKSLKATDSLADLSIDPVDLIEFAVKLDAQFDTNFSEDDTAILDLPNIESIVESILKQNC